MDGEEFTFSLEEFVEKSNHHASEEKNLNEIHDQSIF